ncbi:MAG: hypothetical protein HY818_05265 [Acetobacterium woodii]|nr:hypothetical protein [Acetobacterium woodii]
MDEKQRGLFAILIEAVETISNSEEIKSKCNDMTIECKTLIQEKKLKQGRITMLVEIENVPGRNFDELINSISKLSMEIQSDISKEILNAVGKNLGGEEDE